MEPQKIDVRANSGIRSAPDDPPFLIPQTSKAINDKNMENDDQRKKRRLFSNNDGPPSLFRTLIAYANDKPPKPTSSPEPTQLYENQKIICGICKSNLSTMLELCDHLKIVHELETEVKKLKFETRSEFDQWKTRVEEEGRFRLIMFNKKTTVNSNIEYFRCQHSGGTMKRKRGGTMQCEFTCSAFIIVKTTKRTISVTFCDKHYGHDQETIRDDSWKYKREHFQEDRVSKVSKTMSDHCPIPVSDTETTEADNGVYVDTNSEEMMDKMKSALTDDLKEVVSIVSNVKSVEVVEKLHEKIKFILLALRHSTILEQSAKLGLSID